MHRLFAAFLATAMIGHAAVAGAAASFKIVTASERGTYIQIGQDLARYIAPLADIQLDALPSAGSAENVHGFASSPASSSRSCNPTSTRRFSIRRRQATRRRAT